MSTPSNVVQFAPRSQRGPRPEPQRSEAQRPEAQRPEPQRSEGQRPEPQRPEALWRDGVGAELRQTRAGRGERITDVATRAGIAPQYLSEVERGVKEPSSEVLAAVAGALDLTVGQLAVRVAGRLSGPVAMAA